MWKSKQEKAAYMRERRKRFIAKNMCVMCGKKPPRQKARTCDECWAKHKISSKKCYKKNPEVYLRKSKTYRDKVKIEVLNHYGRICQCCGETIIEFLTLDHMNNDGAKERRENGGLGGVAFYIRLRKRGLPSGYQVLCFNCNCARGIYGYCPHKQRI